MHELSVECPICAGTDNSAIAGPQRTHRYVRCESCGHEWLVPPPTPEALAAYYNGAYSVPLSRYAAAARRDFPGLRTLLASYGFTGGRLLEVGCSHGDMLAHFGRAGWSVEGVEIDARAASHARDHHGLLVHEGTFALAAPELRGAPFDVVALFHVIEHMLDPREFLGQLAPVLRPGGVILLKTPNAESLAARTTAGWWEWRAAPEHVHLYSAASLSMLLAHVGFDVLHVSSRTGDAHTDLFEVLRASAKRLLRRNVDTPAAARNPQGSVPVSQRAWFVAIERLLRVASLPVAAATAVASSGNRQLGPELVVIAERREALPKSTDDAALD